MLRAASRQRLGGQLSLRHHCIFRKTLTVNLVRADERWSIC